MRLKKKLILKVIGLHTFNFICRVWKERYTMSISIINLEIVNL